MEATDQLSQFQGQKHELGYPLPSAQGGSLGPLHSTTKPRPGSGIRELWVSARVGFILKRVDLPVLQSTHCGIQQFVLGF